MLEFIDYFGDNWQELAKLTAQHAIISGIALIISIVIAFPLGIAVSGHKRAEQVLLTGTGLLYTIPSLALFALLIPLTGLGLTTAVIALVIYSLLIIIRNVIIGINDTPPSLLDAASGIGLSAGQIMWRVRIPLALPIFAGGIRIAGVSIIGLATLAAWIGAGGLGLPIFRGIARVDFPPILWGTILVTALGFLFDFVLHSTEKSLKHRAGVIN